MPRDCSNIQEDLVRYGGQVDRLEGTGLEHLSHCPACEKAAREEAELAQLLSQCVPPADEKLQIRIVASLRFGRIRRRVLALTPVAASLIVSLAGIALVGSIPGSSLIAQFPRWSSSSWMSIASTLADWQMALSLVAAPVAESIPLTLIITASVLSMGGLVTVVSLLNRWNTKASCKT